MMVSLICVYNRKKQLEKQLKATLKNQNIPCELIAIDNSQNKFSSAAQALNYGAQNATGEILIFSHQDVYFKTDNELSQLVECIEEKPVGSVVGIAGAIEKKNENIGNYSTGDNLSFELKNRYHDHSIIEVSAVDEVMFGMKRDSYEQHHFDEKLCNDWHLYAVEMCLYHRSKGDRIYVCPVEFHHFSRGKINLKYMQGLLSIADTYRPYFKYIWTTCYKIRSSFIYTRLLYGAWVLNRKLRGKGI